MPMPNALVATTTSSRPSGPRQNLVAPDRRGRGRACDHPGAWQVAEHGADLQILRAEVVTPLADAVGLVDRDQRAVELADEPAETREDEPLGRDVNERELAPRDPRHAPAHLRRLERGGEVGRPPAARLARLG